jgi:hypothetical protein
MSAKLCSNCQSTKHTECCSRCGKLVPSRRRSTGFCSSECVRRQQEEDKLSAQDEEDEQNRKFMPEIAVCEMQGYGYRGYIRTATDQPWIAHNRRIIFNAVEIGRWVSSWPNATVFRYSDPFGRSPDDIWPRACSCCLHLHSSPEQAKFNGQKYFCTWCGDKAPPLVLVAPDNQVSAQSA